MNKIIVICLFIHLLLAMFPASHIIGGANQLRANPAEELNTYEVRIENNLSKVRTTMTVMALTEQDAINNVSLNGWTVLNVRLISRKASTPTIHLPSDSVTTNIPNNIELEDAVIIPDAQSTEPRTPSVSQPIIVSPQTEQQPSTSMQDQAIEVEDNIELLPTSDKLEFVMMLNFALGSVNPLFTDNVSVLLDNLNKDIDYVIFGNTDNVSVGENATYSSNYELSYLRADHIKNLLIEKGHNTDKIRAVGLGSRYPIEPNKKDGSLLNRRVEIYKYKNNN